MPIPFSVTFTVDKLSFLFGFTWLSFASLTRPDPSLSPPPPAGTSQRLHQVVPTCWSNDWVLLSVQRPPRRVPGLPRQVKKSEQDAKGARTRASAGDKPDETGAQSPAALPTHLAAQLVDDGHQQQEAAQPQQHILHILKYLGHQHQLRVERVQGLAAHGTALQQDGRTDR